MPYEVGLLKENTQATFFDTKGVMIKRLSPNKKSFVINDSLLPLISKQAKGMNKKGNVIYIKNTEIFEAKKEEVRLETKKEEVRLETKKDKEVKSIKKIDEFFKSIEEEKVNVKPVRRSKNSK